MPLLTLRAVTVEDQSLVEHLWQVYQHDLSEFRGTHGSSRFQGTLPDESGAYKTRRLLPFFDGDPDRAAYVLYSGTSPVGFALITGLTCGRLLMSDFFVVRGARRRGIARAAVCELFALHPGEWEIPFQDHNVAAARFWRSVAAAFAGDAVHEELRPVPGKPDVPSDVWLAFSVAPSA